LIICVTGCKKKYNLILKNDVKFLFGGVRWWILSLRESVKCVYFTNVLIISDYNSKWQWGDNMIWC